MRLAFRRGKVVEASANNTGRLNAILNSDEGARYIGEFALGFNPYIQEPMRDILFDEKIAGSFHFTPGQAYERADNGNRSQVHWDLVCIQRPEYGGGEIYFDRKLLRKDGLFIPKDIQALNPEHLAGANADTAKLQRSSTAGKIERLINRVSSQLRMLRQQLCVQPPSQLSYLFPKHRQRYDDFSRRIAPGNSHLLASAFKL